MLERLFELVILNWTIFVNYWNGSGELNSGQIQVPSQYEPELLTYLSLDSF